MNNPRYKVRINDNILRSSKAQLKVKAADLHESHTGVVASICSLFDKYKHPYTETDASKNFSMKGKFVKDKPGAVKKGWPDITSIYPDGSGRLWAIEVKVGKDSLRDDQVLVLGHLKQLGAIITIAHSCDDIKKILDFLRAKHRT